jgi:ankyrin repeat protein
MPKAPKWEEEFTRACRKNDGAALKRALAMGLPIHEPIKAYNGISALCSAVIQGAKPEVLQALIDAGADVNSRADAGKSALAAAAETGRADQVKLLLAAGADWTATDAMGFTPLTLACLDKTAGHEQSLRELLAAGARPTVDDLDSACSNGDPLGPDDKLGSPAMIRMLIEAGVDVNGFSRWGTALHRAASNGNVEVGRVLLELGADPKLRIPADEEDCGNMTPLEVAQEFEKKKMVAFLKAAAFGQPPPKRAKGPPGKHRDGSRIGKTKGSGVK